MDMADIWYCCLCIHLLFHSTNICICMSSPLLRKIINVFLIITYSQFWGTQSLIMLGI